MRWPGEHPQVGRWCSRLCVCDARETYDEEGTEARLPEGKEVTHQVEADCHHKEAEEASSDSKIRCASVFEGGLPYIDLSAMMAIHVYHKQLLLNEVVIAKVGL